MPINSVDIATVTVTGDDVVVSGTAGYNNFFSVSEDLYLYVRGGQYGNTWTLIKTYSDVGGFWGIGTLNWSHPLPNLAPGTYEFRVTDQASIIGDDTDTYSGVVIAAANSPPDAVNDTLSAVLEDSGPRSIAASTLLANDTDADENSLSVTAVSNAVGGTVSLSGGTVTFTPSANFNGTASFDYNISDGKGGTDTATASFNVTAVNDGPVVSNDIGDQVIAEDAPWTFTFASNVFTDVDDAVLTYTASLADGSALPAWLNFDGSSRTFAGTPPQDFNGVLDIRVTATDSKGYWTWDSFDLTVTPVNDAPVAVDDTLTVVAGQSGSVNVLANDSDAESQGSLVANDLGSPAVDEYWSSRGLSSGGVFSYTANWPGALALDDGESGTVVYTYTVSDGAQTDTGSITVTVLGVNDTPVAGADSYTIAEDGVLNGTTVLANDTDVDVEPLSAVLVSGPANGALTLNADGTFTYTPNANFNGTDSFTYKANDGTVDSAAVIVALNVTPVNDAPVAGDDVLGDIVEDSGSNAIAAATLLASDTDIDGDTLTVTAVGAAVGGAVSLSGGTITFTPSANYYGPASFTYTVSDGAGGTNTATASFSVTPVNNDAPTFSADSASVSVAENTTAVGTFVAADPDQSGPIYSLMGANASYFTINPITGALSFASAPDYETLTINPLYVTVIATDADNNAVTDQINVTVTVTDVLEPGENLPPEEPEEPPPNPNPGQEEPDPVVLLNDAFRNIMRYEVNAEYRPLVDGLAEQVEDGELTLDEAIGEIVDWADGTTAVATLAYQFFADAVPTAAGLDWLVAPDGPNPNSLNEDYYASFSLDSRFINFAVNLGTQGTTGQAFALEYGAMSVDDAAKAIYLEIFGFAADQAKIDALMDGQVSNGMGGTMTREAYLRSISGGDDIGLKAAFAGWLLSYAATADEGVYSDANEAFLMDIADGGTYNVDIVGVYVDG